MIARHLFRSDIKSVGRDGGAIIAWLHGLLLRRLPGTLPRISTIGIGAVEIIATATASALARTLFAA